MLRVSIISIQLDRFEAVTIFFSSTWWFLERLSKDIENSELVFIHVLSNNCVSVPCLREVYIYIYICIKL